MRCKRAAEDARDKLAGARRARSGLPAGTNYPVAELFRKYGMQAGNIVGTGTFIPSYKPTDHETGQSDNVTPFWMIGGAGAEVEVDTETGHVRVLRLVNVADCGRPLNPKVGETQLSGAAIMQLGFTMFEKMELDGGQVTNASLADYKIPGMRDIPADARTSRRAPRRAPGRSARKGWAKPGRSACRPRSPTRSTTRSACG